MRKGTAILTPAQVRRLLDCARENSARDHALLAIAYNAGLRLSEVVRLRDTWHNPKPDAWLGFAEIDPGGQLVIPVKGRPRQPYEFVFLPPALNSLVGSYLQSTRDARESPYFFPSRNRKRLAPITTRAAQLLFDRTVERSRLDARLSFQALRASLRASLWAAGADPDLIRARMRDKALEYTKRTREIENARAALADPVRTVIL